MLSTLAVTTGRYGCNCRWYLVIKDEHVAPVETCAGRRSVLADNKHIVFETILRRKRLDPDFGKLPVRREIIKTWYEVIIKNSFILVSRCLMGLFTDQFIILKEFTDTVTISG
ncbi:hypothetical protein J6590_049898 [Homalodisca vitripennis]|nr:hypothetical protein J6590_049898 [Homalodisca vitripennis]